MSDLICKKCKHCVSKLEICIYPHTLSDYESIYHAESSSDAQLLRTVNSKPAWCPVEPDQGWRKREGRNNNVGVFI